VSVEVLCIALALHRNYFELSRFDFVLDQDLNVFLMEANMSPNLSSGHFAPNKRFYEQVIYNLLALIGVARNIHTTDNEYVTMHELLIVFTIQIRHARHVRL
jgi:hypothetical protein